MFWPGADVGDETSRSRKLRKRENLPNHTYSVPRARDELFTVASTVCEISAAKMRNSVQRRATQLTPSQLRKTTLRNILESSTKSPL